MLDVHAGAMMDSIFCQLTSDSEVRKDFVEAIQARSNYPNFVAYIEKFRAHSLIAPYRFRRLAVDRHAVRAAGWEKGVKCAISLDSVDDEVFAAEP